MLRRKGLLTLRREDGRIVCEEVSVADTMRRRAVGLLGRRSLPAGKGLVLRPSFSIHTSFMRFPIDAIFLDQDLVVLKIAASLGAFRTASCRGAREVVELPAGECERRGLGIGDRVAWASHALPSDGNDQVDIARGGEARCRVGIASDDARFVKLVRFLLDGKGIDSSVVQVDRLLTMLESEEDMAGLVLDARDKVAATLAEANAIRTRHPALLLVVVGEPEAAKRAPAGIRIYDKWKETDELIAAVEHGTLLIGGSRDHG